MNALQKLRQVANEVRAPTDPMRILPSWRLIGRLLERMPVDRAEAARVCAARDGAALDAMVSRLEGAMAPSNPAEAAADIPAEELEHALRAFRKRLKVMRLADESKLAGRRLTSGRVSEIDAIQPPIEYGEAVWKALARAGRLKHTGQGFYALP